MRLRVDSDSVSRGGSEVVELASTLRGLVRQAEQTVASLATSTGHDGLQRELEALADAIGARGSEVARSLHSHGLQVRLAAQTYVDTDADLAADVPTTGAPGPLR